MKYYCLDRTQSNLQVMPYTEYGFDSYQQAYRYAKKHSHHYYYGIVREDRLPYVQQRYKESL